MASTNLIEKANGTRLSRLLIDKGTEAMRQTFDSMRPPGPLATVLILMKTKLQKLLNRKVITKVQWDVLYPALGFPNSKNFDVTLLMILFRNICNLPKPKTGWNSMPPDTDTSVEANIVRIKMFRNEVYAHIADTEVDDSQFEYLWLRISNVLVDLGTPQREIDELKDGPLSPEEEVYVHRLKDWKRREDECKEILDDVKTVVQDLDDVVVETQHNVKETQRTVQGLERVVMETQHGVKKTQRTVQAFESEMVETQLGVKETQSAIAALREENKDLRALLAKHIVESCKHGNDSEDKLLKLAKYNFKGDIRRFVKSFHEGTRQWLFKRLGNWFTNQESRVMILTAGPGVGKSVFAGKVSQVYQETGRLAAYHFCKFNDSNLRNPLIMLQSLASQICDNVKDFKEELLEQLKRPHLIQSLGDAFRVYLNEPLQNLQGREPMLIVIDGLDESEADGKSELLELIAEEFCELPEWVKFLVTSRPEIPVKRKLSHLNPVEILPDNKDNELDLQQYLEFRLPSLSVGKTIIPLLVKKCQGSFLFAFHVQSELLKHENLEDIPTDEMEHFLPRGIGSVYEKYFHRFQNELKAVNEEVDLFSLLEILVAARGPLPLTFVAEVLGMSANSRSMKEIISKVNESLSALLYVCDEHVTVFHKSVVDWLTSNGYDEHSYTIEKETGNQRLWGMCKNEYQNIKEKIPALRLTNEMKYSLQYGSSHLIAVHEKSGVECDYEWLVDVVIVHVISVVYPGNVQSLKVSWKQILQLNGGPSPQLRIKISWHLFESEHGQRGYPSYLQGVINYSPDDCFSGEDKRTAKILLRKFIWCEKLNASYVENKNYLLSERLFSSDITCVGMSSNKRFVAVGQEDGTVSVLELPELNELCRHSTGSSVPCCTFSYDNTILLYGRLGRCFDVGANRERSFFHNSDERFLSSAFSLSDQRLLTANGCTTIKLWDITEQCLLALLRCAGPVDCCIFSKSGLFIIGRLSRPSRFCESSDSMIVWNAITLQRIDQRNAAILQTDEVTVMQEKLIRENDGLDCVTCFCSEYNNVGIDKSSNKPTREIIISTNKSDVDVYALPKSLPVAQFRGGVYFSCSLFVTNFKGVDCIWGFNRQSLKIIDPLHLTKLAVHDLSIVSPSFLPRHRSSEFWERNMTAINQNSVLYKDRRELLVFNLPPKQQRPNSSSLSSLGYVVTCSFSPDGSHLASCTTDDTVSIWSVHKCRVVQRFTWCGKQLSACWWSTEFLWIFHFAKDIPTLSRYPVDQQLKIRVSEVKHQPVDFTLQEILTFSEIIVFAEGVLIFRCLNSPTKVLNISDTGIKTSLSLSREQQIECAAVSPGGSTILAAGVGKFRIWRRNVKSPKEYEKWKENQFPYKDRNSSTGIISYSGCRSMKCCMTSDGKIGLISSESVMQEEDIVYFSSECNQSDPCDRKEGKIIYIVLNMDTGDITNYYFDSLFHNFQRATAYHISDFNIFISENFFVVRGWSNNCTTVNVFDIDSGKLVASLSETKTLEGHQELDQDTTFSQESNILAVPRNNGFVHFIKIHVPE